MVSNEVNVYCIFITKDLKQIQQIVERLFPSNESRVIETGTVFLSIGDIFECSVEPIMSRDKNQLYMSATYKNSDGSYYPFLSNLISELSNSNIVYSVDSEFKKEDGYHEENTRHPDYDRLITDSGV